MTVTTLAYLMDHIQHDPESAIVAVVLGWTYIPSGAERAQWDIAEMKFNSQRAKGTIPIRLTRPWAAPKGTPSASPKLVAVDSPERLAAIARLKSNS